MFKKPRKNHFYVFYAHKKTKSLMFLKATAANFPKTTVAVVHLLSLVGLTSLERSRDVLAYILQVNRAVT
jgi:hypothetical protein